MRVDKVLANYNFGSRKDVKNMLNKNLVSVNGEFISKSDYHINEGDKVCVSGECFTYQKYYYLILHKPNGYLCANHDKKHQTVFELLPKFYQKDFHIVGRLDLDTEGLLIITNNGEFTHNVTSPNKRIAKVYEVHLENDVDESYIEIFANGIKLSDFVTGEAKLEIINSRKCLLTIYEGKFHQVKRMFGAVENKVTYLKRLSIGNLHLRTLPIGEYRSLPEDEINSMVFN